MATFTLTASISAPIETVFEVLSDHRGYAEADSAALLDA